MTDHLHRVLQQVLRAWDGFMAGDVDLDALRDSVRAAHGSLDGGDADWRDLLDDCSLNLDGLDERVTRYRSQDDVRAEVGERFSGMAASIRTYLAAD